MARQQQQAKGVRSTSTRERLILARKLWDWKPHSQEQADWFLSEAKKKVAACGRRFGKSESGAIDLATYFLSEPNHFQLLFAPEYSATDIIYTEVVNRLLRVPGLRDTIRYTSAPPFVVEWKAATGKYGYIMARTANRDARSIRGYKFHRALGDEAAQISDSVIEQVVEPTLADYDGQLALISTPYGMNHFFRAFVSASDPANRGDEFAIQLPTAINPYIPRDFLERRERTVTWRTWQVEYLARFLTDAGGVFRNVDASIDTGRVENERPIPGRQYGIGWDLARKRDFSVIVIIDLATRQQVFFDRFQGMDWERQADLVAMLCMAYNNAQVVFDSTGLGDPVHSMLNKRNVYCSPYLLSAPSKQRLIDNCALLVEGGSMRLMDCPAQTNELKQFQYEETPSGRVKMSAPEGMNDDCVLALGFAAWMLAPTGGWAFDKECLEMLAKRRGGGRSLSERADAQIRFSPARKIPIDLSRPETWRDNV